MKDSVHPEDLANFSLNALKMESTNLYSVGAAFVGALMSTEMNLMELRLMEVRNLDVQINQYQVFISPVTSLYHYVSVGWSCFCVG